MAKSKDDIVIEQDAYLAGITERTARNNPPDDSFISSTECEPFTEKQIEFIKKFIKREVTDNLSVSLSTDSWNESYDVKITCDINYGYDEITSSSDGFNFPTQY